MLSTLDVKTSKPIAATASIAVLAALRWAIDRMLSVWYGTVYDFIFERFAPYQALQREVLQLVEASVPDAANRRDVRVVEINCGPGNFTFPLAQAGFSVVGVDPYAALVELSREKRRSRHLANLAFQHADLLTNRIFGDASFDWVVNVHSLYAHPAPERLLEEAYRILKRGGRAVFVNFTRRVPLGTSFRAVKAREGWRPAFACLVWVLPNAVFELLRRPSGPHYWDEEAFTTRLRAAGFTILELRRTFFTGASLLASVKKESDGEKGGTFRSTPSE